MPGRELKHARRIDWGTPPRVETRAETPSIALVELPTLLSQELAQQFRGSEKREIQAQIIINEISQNHRRITDLDEYAVKQSRNRDSEGAATTYSRVQTLRARNKQLVQALQLHFSEYTAKLANDSLLTQYS